MVVYNKINIRKEYSKNDLDHDGKRVRLKVFRQPHINYSSGTYEEKWALDKLETVTKKMRQVKKG